MYPVYVIPTKTLAIVDLTEWQIMILVADTSGPKRNIVGDVEANLNEYFSSSSYAVKVSISYLKLRS